jgi:hypothetical protein
MPSIYVSSYYCICVLKLTCMCSHTTHAWQVMPAFVRILLYASLYYMCSHSTMCVFIPLCVSSYYYTWPHTTIHVASCYYFSSAAPSSISSCLIPATPATHTSTDHPRTLLCVAIFFQSIDNKKKLRYTEAQTTHEQ